MLGPWVKTLDRLLGLGDGNVLCFFPPEGIIMELRFLLARRAVIGGLFQILAWTSLGFGMGGLTCIRFFCTGACWFHSQSLFSAGRFGLHDPEQEGRGTSSAATWCECRNEG